MAEQPPKKKKSARKKTAKKAAKSRKKAPSHAQESTAGQSAISEDIVVVLGKDENAEEATARSQTIEPESLVNKPDFGKTSVTNSQVESSSQTDPKAETEILSDPDVESIGGTVETESATVVVAEGDILEVSTTNNYWILQALPKRFDFRKELAPSKTIPWRVAKYIDRVRVGDLVFYWKAGEQAGFYGWGEVSTVPAKAENGEFWMQTECIQTLNFPLLKNKQSIARIIGEGHQLLTARTGAIFHLDDAHARVLHDHIVSWEGNGPIPLPPKTQRSFAKKFPDEVQRLMSKGEKLGLRAEVSEHMVSLLWRTIDGITLNFLTLALDIAEVDSSKLLAQADRLGMETVVQTAARRSINLFESFSEENPASNRIEYLANSVDEWLDFVRDLQNLILEDVEKNNRSISDFDDPDELVKRLLPLLNIVNDKWTVEDALGYDDYAEVITHFIKHKDTSPPLTVSIQAPWGAGKTSLMRMIQKKLDPEAFEEQPYFKLASPRKDRPGIGDFSKEVADLLKFKPDRNDKDPNGLQTFNIENWVTVWFNPWKYESSDQIWAGLADSIIRQTGDRLPIFDREWFYLQLHLRRFNVEKFRRHITNNLIDKIPETGLRLAGLALLLVSALMAAVGELGSTIFPASVTAILGSGALVAHPINRKLKEITAEREKNEDALKLSEFVEVPNYDEKLGFRHSAELDIKRIHASIPRDPDGKPKFAIFIDDLDRCSPTKIAKVFEAINLLVADDIAPSYFIIGMDGEIVSAALESHYKDLFKTLPASFRTDSIGWHYLDKFVQLPFVIPPVDPTKLKSLGIDLSEQSGNGEFTEPNLGGSGDGTSPEERDPNNPDPGTDTTIPSTESPRGGTVSIRTPEETVAAAVINKVISTFDEEVTDTVIAEQLIRESGWDFDNNPRTLKRCINLARFHLLIRVLKEWRAEERESVSSEQDKPEDQVNSIPDKEHVIHWVLFAFRWPDVARWVQTGSTGLLAQNFRNFNAKADNPGEPCAKTRIEWLHKTARDAKSDLRTWQTSLAGLEKGELPTSLDNHTWINDRELLKFCAIQFEQLAENAEKGFW